MCKSRSSAAYIGRVSGGSRKGGFVSGGAGVSAWLFVRIAHFATGSNIRMVHIFTHSLSREPTMTNAFSCETPLWYILGGSTSPERPLGQTLNNTLQARHTAGKVCATHVSVPSPKMVSQHVSLTGELAKAWLSHHFQAPQQSELRSKQPLASLTLGSRTFRWPAASSSLACDSCRLSDCYNTSQNRMQT